MGPRGSESDPALTSIPGATSHHKSKEMKQLNWFCSVYAFLPFSELCTQDKGNEFLNSESVCFPFGLFFLCSFQTPSWAHAIRTP